METHRTLTLLTILILAVGAAAAAEPLNRPTEPHQFFGSITINGQPAPNGMIIEAYMGTRIQGDDPASGVTATSASGKYGYNPWFFFVQPDRSRPNENPGTTIRFYLVGDNGQYYDLGTGVYQPLATTQRDFTITCSGCIDAPSSGGSSGGSGGGSSGGSSGSSSGSGSSGSTSSSSTSGSTSADADANAGVCTPDWRCSEWTSCSNNERKRVCIDRNDCGVEDDMPVMTESCGQSDEEVLTGTTVSEEPAQGNFLTGLVTGAGGLGALFFFIALGLFIGALVWRSKKR